jgi:RIO kinase 2
MLDEILENVRTAYHTGVIHADLSEFNIMVEGGRCIIIDWPQWMEADHQNSQHIIARDVENILAYFRRKYRVNCQLEDALRCVTG